MKRAVAGLCAALLAWLCPVVGGAAGPRPSRPEAAAETIFSEGTALGLPVTITADSLSYDETTGVATAEGNVELAFGGRSIRAERIRYDSKNHVAEFVSDVRYREAGDEFSFERITLDLENETGVLSNGRIRLSTNNYQIASERIEKTGKRTFFIRKGRLTTCPCCDPPPDWSFEVGESRVTIDGYAVGKNVTMRVRGIPVLWLPYAAFPVKLTRQSGLLLPSFLESPSRGFTFSLPFYWAINGWSDATITLESMSKRGIRPEVEYRFALNPDSEGEIRATAYRDRQIKETRHRFFGKNVFRYGDVTANAQYDIASDERYYVDLVDQDILRTARHVPSRAFVSKESGSTGHALGIAWVQDTQGAPSDNVVQRLPEYTATLLPRALGKSGAYASGRGEATYFFRRAGERLVRGRGLVELARPVTLFKSVVLTPRFFADFAGTGTAGGEGGDGKAARVVPGASAVVTAEVRRDFERKGMDRLVHALSLRAGFTWVSPVGQEDSPLVDQWSRIARRGEWTIRLDQRLLGIGAAGPAELASMEIEWALDTSGGAGPRSPYVDPLSPYARALRDQVDLGVGHRREEEAVSDLFGRFRAVLRPRWTVSGESLYDVPEGRIVSSALLAEWQRDKENRAAFGYRVTRTLAEDLEARLAVRPFRSAGFQGSVQYSLRNAELTDGQAAITLFPKSDCWSVGVVVGRRARPAETSVRLTFSLKGIGSVGN